MIQLQFLNYLLDKKDLQILSYNNISEDFFSDYKKEFNYIKDHIDKYGKIPDKESFLSCFPDFDMIEVKESPNYLVTELYKDKNTRTLAKTFNSVRDLLTEGKVEEAISLVNNSSAKLCSSSAITCIDILKDTSRYDAYIERCNDFSKYYLKTGFKELDEVIGGWDKQEELATIVARPNVGKSWILLKCVVAAAQQGLNVGIYSGEMSDRKVGYRLDTLLGHISNRKILQGEVDIQTEYKKYLDNLSKEVKGSIKVLTPKMIGGYATPSRLRAFIEKEHLDVLYIDQHSLLDDDRHSNNPVERAANISKDLKNIQVTEQIPIITVSQQNRSSVENGVSTSNVAASDRISQDSTILIFLEKKDNILTLNLIKSRDSVNEKKLQYAVDFDKGIFTYIPIETDALSGKDCNDLKEEFDVNVSEGEDVF